MPTWNTEQYLKFASERTRPAIDLAARVAVVAPRRVADLGCGPGNSTTVLAQRWPDANLVGLDQSPAMLEAARSSGTNAEWQQADIAAWQPGDKYDVVFSNAALQWVPDHRRLFPRLLQQVAADGALAVQMPANADSPPHRLVRELAASPTWRSHFVTPPREWQVHPVDFYYDILTGHAARLEIWCTDYMHVLADLDAIIDWYRGSGLRPWLDALPDDATRTRFLGAYRARLVPYFPTRADGRVLFPFRRLFLIAYP